MPPHHPRAGLAAAVLSAVALGSCGDGPADPYDAARCARLVNDPESTDAYEWLKAPSPVPRRPGAMTVDEALALVHQFEARGAERPVAVGNREVRPAGGGAPYFASSGLVIRLPDDPARRIQVFRLYAEQVRNNGYTPRADTGQTTLFIPWTRDGADPDAATP